MKHPAIIITVAFVMTLFSCQQDNKGVSPVVKGNAYYLGANGNDNNDGSKNNPWKTIDHLNSIQLHPGDTVFFKGGELFAGTIVIDSNDHGIAGKPVVITSYGAGDATIDAGNNVAMRIDNSAYITVIRLELIGAGRREGNTKDGLFINHSHGIVADSIAVRGFQKSGLLVYNSSDTRITNINAFNNGFAGISVSGERSKDDCSNIYIGYCKAENNPGDPTNLTNHSGNGIIAGLCRNVTIEYCTATNNGWDMPRTGNGPVGIWCYEADSVIIQHCLSYRNKTSAGGDDGGGFDLDGGVTNSMIQYCLSYENQGSAFGIFQYAGASAWHNNTIRYNISENDGRISAARAGIYIWNSSDDSTQFYNCLFYNNTIYNGEGSAISFAGQSKRKGFLFYNNIFVAGDNLLKGKRMNDVFLANNWWSLKNKFNIEGTTDLEEWAKKTGQETMAGKLAGLNIDPGFKNAAAAGAGITSNSGLKLFNGYKVPADSPLSQEGLDLQGIYRIETGGIGFNGQPAPVKGIGSTF